ncbi:hypothetical protein AMS68_002000 [Peltaster fructicola]|uniref:Phosphoglycerate mutase-like protein n=1 Tax=Peltaster fructicola TaxID=286661 RepID=A0A6H0XP41_9PEZI|nr:hypothetical protein AMS68_002000 [Peltaster fructicola]
MVLEYIYVVRHGYRMNWVVNPATGEYNSSFPTPTGIASDPTLAAYGVKQAEQLGAHLHTVQPPVDLIYSSPWYRCLQTLQPFVTTLADKRKIQPAAYPGLVQINLETGLGEFFGRARFDHPSPAPVEELKDLFPNLHAEEFNIVPSTNGETIPGLHDRVAYALNELVKRADADPNGPKTLLICSHAAIMICIGRILTGRMPEDECEDDFKCYTCAFSRYSRRSPQTKAIEVQRWSSSNPESIPDVSWRGGAGVAGGWNCEVNGDCSFLSGGEERGWRFSGDESFLKDPNAFNDAANTSTPKDNAKL